MQFFKSVPDIPETKAPVVERRGDERFPVHPEFPLKAVLSFIGRDDTGVPMSDSRHNWSWKGRLIEFSAAGASVQMKPGVRAVEGDDCDLMLTVEDLEVTVSSRISNIRDEPEGPVFGLQHAIDDEAVWTAYRKLLEVVSLGASLAPHFRLTEPDDSGFLPEQYAGEWGSRLTVWRQPADESVVAFEMQLNDGVVRAAAGQGVEYLACLSATESRPASDIEEGRLRRLFQWVVPNLGTGVPDDVREFLKLYA